MLIRRPLLIIPLLTLSMSGCQADYQAALNSLKPRATSTRCIIIDPKTHERRIPDTPPSACARTKDEGAPSHAPPVPLPGGGVLVPIRKTINQKADR